MIPKVNRRYLMSEAERKNEDEFGRKCRELLNDREQVSMLLLYLPVILGFCLFTGFLIIIIYFKLVSARLKSKSTIFFCKIQIRHKISYQFLKLLCCPVVHYNISASITKHELE